MWCTVLRVVLALVAVLGRVGDEGKTSCHVVSKLSCAELALALEYENGLGKAST